MRKDQTVNEIAAGLSILLGGRSQVLQNAIGIGANLESLHFSRQVEEAADQKGAVTCAQAGYNPWGMVWLFQQFSKADAGGQFEMLSDHPTDQHRIAALEQEFKQNRALFGHFSSNIATATPMPPYQRLAYAHPHAGPFAPARRPGY
jgi:predicted Zn-dependent protease